MPVRLVTFDALYTLLEPRAPIAVQYAELFRPHFGVLDPAAIQTAFKSAYKLTQKQTPSARTPPEQFWGTIIRETALGAGADPDAVHASLPELVPALLRRFGSSEGYALYDDTIPALEKLHEMNIKTGLVSNADSRILDALADLGAAKYLDPILLSEREGVEKPSMAIFQRAATRGRVSSYAEVLHVGDELGNDYDAAWNASIPALLLRRPGVTPAHGDEYMETKVVAFVDTVESLHEVVERVARKPEMGLDPKSESRESRYEALERWR